MNGTFNAWDYIVFVLFLLLSIGVGLFFAFTGGKQKSKDEFLRADKELSPLPVALSMAATFMSAISMIGTPAEVYLYGPSLLLVGFAFSTACLISAVTFVPLLYKANVTSAYEFLELRFESRWPKLAATFVTVLSGTFYGGVAVYAAAMALEPVTDIDPWLSMTIVSVVSSIYSTLGGLKAVVWVDALQAIVMLGGILALLIAGIIRVGGLSEVFEINSKYGHSTVFISDPLNVYSFWNTLIFASLSFVSKFGVHQAFVQRYCAMPTLRKAQWATILTGVLLLIPWFLLVSTGYVMFAFYQNKGCDPLESKQVTNTNHLVSNYMMEILNYPCVPGLFISSICCAVLSSISSMQSAVAAVIWEDLLKNLSCFRKAAEKKKVICIKCLVLLSGLVSLAVGFVIYAINVGTVFKLVMSFVGATGGPVLGLFLLASVFPFVNTKASLIGSFFGILIPLWLSFGSLIYPWTDHGGLKRTPVSTENCTVGNTMLVLYNTNMTYNGTAAAYYPIATAMDYGPDTTTMMMNTSTESSHTSGFTMAEFYGNVPYIWYGLIGWLLTCVVALVVTPCTGTAKTDRRYIMPIISRCYHFEEKPSKVHLKENIIWTEKARYSDYKENTDL